MPYNLIEWTLILLGFLSWLGLLAYTISLKRRYDFLLRSRAQAMRSAQAQVYVMSEWSDDDSDEDDDVYYGDEESDFDSAMKALDDEAQSLMHLLHTAQQRIADLEHKLSLSKQMLDHKDEEVRRFAEMNRDIQNDYDQFVAFNSKEEVWPSTTLPKPKKN